MARDYSYFSYFLVHLIVFLGTFPFVWFISIALTQNYIIPWVIMIIILSLCAVLWRFRREINLRYKTRERKKAERKGKALKHPTKIKIGKARRNYRSRGTIPLKWTYTKSRNIEIYCNGAGTKDDPFILDELFPLPKRVVIFDETRYFLIKNINLKNFGLENCENFIFKNCEFKEFRFKTCSNIIIEEIIIIRENRLMDCKSIAFKKSLIRNVIINKSNDGVFHNCYIIHLKEWKSRNNTFTNNTIEFLESHKKNATFNKQNTLKDNKIGKSNYKMKKIFHFSLKSELPIILWSIFFFCFTFIGFFIVIGLSEQGIYIWYWFLVIPGNFVYFALMAAIGFYLNDFYFKSKLKKGK